MQEQHQSLCKLKHKSKAFNLIWYLGDKGAALGWINPRRPATFSLNDYHTALYNLRNAGLINKKEQKIILSEEGIIEYVRTKVEETDELPKGIVCIVVFDIPEKNRKIRKLLSTLLTELVFFRFQKSVWVSQFDNAKALKKLLVMLKIKKWVRIYTGKEE